MKNIPLSSPLIPLVLVLMASVSGLLFFYFTIDIRTYLQGFVNLFAGGRSTVKVLLFFVFMSVLCLGILVMSKKCISRNINKKMIGVFAGLLIACGVTSFLSSLWFFSQYSVLLDEFVITFTDNELSSTEIVHSHLFKGSIALVLHAVGIEQLASMDAGLVYTEVVPMWLLILYGIMSLLLVFVIIYVGAVLYSSQNTFLRRFILVILYGISSFSIIKNTIDGGLLNPEVIPSMLVIVLLLSAPSRRVVNGIGIGLLYACIYGIFQALHIIDVQEVIQKFGLRGWIITLLLLMLFSLLSAKQSPRLTSVLMLPLFVLLIAVAITASSRELLYSNLSLSPGAIIASYVSYPFPSNMTIHSFHLNELEVMYVEPSTSTLKVGDILEHSKTPGNYDPIQIVGATCNPEEQTLLLSAVVHTLRPLPELKVTIDEKLPISIHSIEKLSDNSMNLIIRFDPCFQVRPNNVIHEILKTYYLTPAFVYNLNFNRVTYPF